MWENCGAIAFVYMVVLLAAASLNYIPGLTDAEGRAFGVFALDIYDDCLHVASALWAGIAAAISSRASRIFLRYFGLLYLHRWSAGARHRLRVTSTSGIMNHGVLDLPLTFKILANLPHIAGGGIRGLLQRALRHTRRDDPPSLAPVRRALTLRSVLKWPLAGLLVGTLLLLCPGRVCRARRAAAKRRRRPTSRSSPTRVSAPRSQHLPDVSRMAHRLCL